MRDEFESLDLALNTESKIVEVETVKTEKIEPKKSQSRYHRPVVKTGQFNR